MICFPFEYIPSLCIPSVEIEELKASEWTILFPFTSCIAYVVLTQAWGSTLFGYPEHFVIILLGIALTSVAFVLHKGKNFGALSWVYLHICLLISIVWLGAAGGLIIDVIKVKKSQKITLVYRNHL